MMPSAPSRPGSRALRWALLLVLLVTALSLPFVLFEDVVERFTLRTLAEVTGGPELALLITGALTLDVLLPVPSSLVTISAGATLGFGLGTLVCWTGMTFGCLFGYWIGATGGTALLRRVIGEGELAQAGRTADRIGAPALVLTRAVPVLAETSTLAAGAARYPLGRFVIVTAIANAGIAAAYVGVGAFALSMNSFLMAFTGAIALPVLAWGVFRVVARSAATGRSG